MYFSMIRLRQSISANDMATMTRGDGYQTHKLVWNLFADHSDRKRDFIYRHNPLNGWPTFYAVSRREPVDSSGVWEVTSKEYHPKLRAGQRLSFSLCANPIRSKKDENSRQHRHDVIMDAKLALKKEGGSINLPTIIQEYGSRWLLERADAHGFSVSPSGVRADGYRQHRLIKGKNKQPIMYSTIDLNGILMVVNPDLFVEECLFNGIGPAKGFGCGLMLVKRI
jgi:CRISPR system Cascade subunit CasE